MTNFQAVYRLDAVSMELHKTRVAQIKEYNKLFKFRTARECQVLLMLDERGESEVSHLEATIDTLIRDIKRAEEQNYASRLLVETLMKHAEGAIQRAHDCIAKVQRTAY